MSDKCQGCGVDEIGDRYGWHDGFCPVCLATEYDRLRETVAKLRRPGRTVVCVLDVARDADDGMQVVYTGCVTGMPPRPDVASIDLGRIVELPEETKAAAAQARAEAGEGE